MAEGGRVLQRRAWQWALANRRPDGSLPTGTEVARRVRRSQRWGRLQVTNTGLATVRHQHMSSGAAGLARMATADRPNHVQPGTRTYRAARPLPWSARASFCCSAPRASSFKLASAGRRMLLDWRADLPSHLSNMRLPSRVAAT